ncbi:uncharacterized protein B0H64DRAFT_136209 [Chaetomium fimeti]|uniref:C2H2-type domain-containing protein n=1 Tax=Chaetomium fimeti TaxID=1854472 RepID=A0AAE0HKS4_9PEZI|nr:hypothetical protein B0H64DRAFT_136209 [Chaetomium fimeti]
MELTEAPVLNLSLDFGNDADFDFNSLGAGWPSGSVSGSSCASSSFGPHTPTSGRSTPHYSASFDFSSSFASSTGVVPFDPSPPSSATSTYFPMTPKSSNVSNFVYPVFPATPSRGQLVFSCDPLSSYTAQLTPSQNMDCSFPMNHVDSHSYLAASSALGQYDHLPNGVSHWTYPDSPISFDQHSPAGAAQSVQSIKQEFDEDMMTPMTPSVATKKRVLMDETRHRAMALQQQMQQCSPSKSRTRAKRAKKRRTGAAGDDNFSMDAVEPATKCKCPVEGCDKRYRRSEHMKRHIQSVHEMSVEKLFRCDWCPHTSNRLDNLTAHIKLHWAPREHPGSKPRVKYCPAARLQWEKMVQNQRRGGGGAKPKTRSNSAK